MFKIKYNDKPVTDDWLQIGEYIRDSFYLLQEVNQGKLYHQLSNLPVVKVSIEKEYDFKYELYLTMFPGTPNLLIKNLVIIEDYSVKTLNSYKILLYYISVSLFELIKSLNTINSKYLSKIGFSLFSSIYFENLYLVKVSDNKEYPESSRQTINAIFKEVLMENDWKEDEIPWTFNLCNIKNFSHPI